MERKEFLKKLIVNGSLAAVLPSLILQSCEEEEPMDDPMGGSNGTNTEIVLDLNEPANADLNKTGGFKYLTNENIIVINTGNNEFVALSSLCTHKGCKVGYTPGENILPCPCHGSIFSIDGSVLNGPANTPLRTYESSLEDNILTLKK